MNYSNLNVNFQSLSLSFLLVVFAIVISYKEKIKLEKDIIISVIRMIIQLCLVGYILGKIIDVNNVLLNLSIALIIILNATHNSGKRGEKIENSYFISFVALSVSTTIILCILVLSGTIEFTPQQLIPVTGMVVGNSMTAIGLAYTNLLQIFEDQGQKVQEKLALGANPRQASENIIQITIKNGMQPSIDRVRTTGLVSLPDMMSGLIFAGINPSKAILYQIMVMFMVIATSGITTYIGTHLAYKKFFTDRYQSKTNIWEE